MHTTRTDPAAVALPPGSASGGSQRRAVSRWLAWALAGVAGVIAVFVLRAWTPSNDPNATICIFRRLTHHECATCGMTRAMALLARGDVRGAFARHPLAPLLALEIVLLWLATPLAITRGLRVPPLVRDRWLLAHAAAFLLLWVVRLLR